MKKFSALFTFLFIVSSTFGQLNVRPVDPALDSYIYVKGNVLFVNQYIKLNKNYNPETEASIYLRREAQLIQGTAGSSTNSGDGLLSVFQEGTSNAYDYNYWSSPISTASPGSNLYGIDIIYSPISHTRALKAASSSLLNGVASPLNISRQWIYTYSGEDYAAWNHIGHKTSIPVGFGFTMKGVDGVDPTMVEGRENNPGNAQRYDFRGKPNDGNIEVPVVTGADVLVGNPYPSALDLSLFLIENSGSGSYSSSCYGPIPRESNITGIAYFWDSSAEGSSHYLQDYVGGYGAFSPVDPCTKGIYEKPVFKTYTSDGGATGEEGNHYDRRFTPIAQGFMVRGSTNSNITFRNRHRIFKKEGENSDFKFSDNSVSRKVSKLKVIPKLRLQIIVNDHYARNLTLAFWPTATDTVDFGMDARAHSLAPTDAGWLQKDKNYVIDVRPFDEVAEIPLFLKVGNTAGKISFQVREFEDFSTKNIFLHDTSTGNYHSIKDNPYEVHLEPGTYHGRFRISFQNDEVELPAAETNAEEENLEIFQNNRLGRLEISNIAPIPIVAVSLYDLSGKQLYVLDIKNKENWQLETRHFPNAVYLVKLAREDGSLFQKKITIHN